MVATSLLWLHLKENQTVWGRGSVDAKFWLVSIMTTLESMIESGYTPNRSVIASWVSKEEGIFDAKIRANERSFGVRERR